MFIRACVLIKWSAKAVYYDVACVVILQSYPTKAFTTQWVTTSQVDARHLPVLRYQQRALLLRPAQ